MILSRHYHDKLLERRGKDVIMLDPSMAITLQWIFVASSAIAVGLRAYNRCLTSRRTCPTDYIILLALLMFATGVGLNTFQFADGDWHMDTISVKMATKFYKMAFVSFLLFYTVLWTVKLTLISIYAALFPSSLTRLQIAVKATWYITLVSFFFCIGMNIFYCGRPSRNWESDPENDAVPTCVSYRGAAYITTLALHLFTEIVIFLLPFGLLHHFRLSFSKGDYIRVAAVFGLGCLGVIATTVRVVCVVVDSPPPVVATWLAMEQMVAIGVVCSPALKKSFLKAMHASLGIIMDTFRQNLKIKDRLSWAAGRKEVVEICDARAMKEEESGSERSMRMVQALDVRCESAGSSISRRSTPRPPDTAYLGHIGQ